MRRLVCFGIGMLFGVAALGQDLLDCVHPDVVGALIFPGGQGGTTTVSAAVPEELSDIDIPSQFEWIGSVERDLGILQGNPAARAITAAFATSLPPDAARAAALDALAADGWEVQRQPQGPGGGVFESAAMPPAYPACRDGQSINITSHAIDGRTYLRYAFTRGNRTPCDMTMRSAFMSAPGLEEYLPSLALPVDPITGEPAFMGGSGGSGTGLRRNFRVEFRLDDSAASVARHFGQQMADQAWRADASWSGATTAGSTWSRETDGGNDVHASLQVTAVADDQFTVVLQLNTLQ